MLSSCASFFDMEPFFFEPLSVDKALTIEIPGVSGFGHLRGLEADFLRAVPQHGLAQGRQILQT
jgi:hypothetical protein